MLNVDVIATKGLPGPLRALECEAKLKWSAAPAFLLDLRGSAIFNGRIVANRIEVRHLNWEVAILTKDEDLECTLTIPFSDEALRYIENHRQADDVMIGLNLDCRLQEAVEPPSFTARTEQMQGRQRGLTGGRVFWRSAGPGFRKAIPLSDWLKRLKELEWEEYAIFEVRAEPLRADDKFATSLKRLEEAQNALRSFDYPTVLAKCRAAFEAAAKYQAEGRVAQGFALLLERAFPGVPQRQELVNAIIGTLSEYAHTLGRHEQYPTAHVSRAEAEFFFTTTVGLFGMLTRSIAAAGRES